MSRLKRKINAFLRADSTRKRLAIEALWELSRARTQTLRHSKTYTRDIGAVGKIAEKPTPKQVELAMEVGHVVLVVAKYVPFRAVCLQQAIAVRRMLHRRNVPVTVYFGLARAAKEDASVLANRDAHAWVAAGDAIVAGDTELDRFVVVGTFA